MYASICAMAVNFALVLFLAEYIGIGGIALASGIAVAVGCIFNYIALLKRDKVLFVRADVTALIKMALSSAVMAVAVYFISSAVNSNLIKLLLGVSSGVVVYFIMCVILRVDEVKYAINALREKLSAKKV